MKGEYKIEPEIGGSEIGFASWDSNLCALFWVDSPDDRHTFLGYNKVVAVMGSSLHNSNT